MIIYIFTISLFLLIYVASILFLTSRIRNIFIRKSLAYVKNAVIYNINYLPVSFSIKLILQGLDISELDIKSVKVTFTSLRKLEFIFPINFNIIKSTSIEKVEFDQSPHFVADLKKNRDFVLKYPIKAKFVAKSDSNYSDIILNIDNFSLKNAAKPTYKSEIFLNCYYKSNKKIYNISTNFQTEHGISSNSKSKFLKKLNIKYFKLDAHSESSDDANLLANKLSVNLSSNMEYKLLQNPIGKVDIEIENPDNFLLYFFNNQKNNYIPNSISNFIKIMKKHEYQNDILSLKFLFLADGVLINSIPLKNIKQEIFDIKFKP